MCWDKKHLTRKNVEPNKLIQFNILESVHRSNLVAITKEMQTW